MSVQREDVINMLRSYLLAKVLAPGTVLEDDTPLAEVGIDSVTVIELSMRIEDRFGIEIPADQLLQENLRSMAALADCAVRQAV